MQRIASCKFLKPPLERGLGGVFPPLSGFVDACRYAPEQSGEERSVVGVAGVGVDIPGGAQFFGNAEPVLQVVFRRALAVDQEL